MSQFADNPAATPIGREPGVSYVFPPSLPAVMSDAEAIRNNDWFAFRSLSIIENHWELKSWADGYEAYYWYLTFDQPALTSLTTTCQQNLSSGGLDFIPLDALHSTVLKVAAVDSVNPETLSRVISDATERLKMCEPFDLSVGPLTGSPSAIRFSVAPWGDLMTLHVRLRDCTSRILPSIHFPPTSGFRPHIGIAYNNQRRAADSIITEIAGLRSVEPVNIQVRQVSLVRLGRIGQEYHWKECATIPLGF